MPSCNFVLDRGARAVEQAAFNHVGYLRPSCRRGGPTTSAPRSTAAATLCTSVSGMIAAQRAQTRWRKVLRGATWQSQTAALAAQPPKITAGTLAKQPITSSGHWYRRHVLAGRVKLANVEQLKPAPASTHSMVMPGAFDHKLVLRGRRPCTNAPCRAVPGLVLDAAVSRPGITSGNVLNKVKTH